MGTDNSVTRNVIRNTKSNYVLVFVRVALGLITFRLLFQRLTDEEFGYWSFLWSLFGFGALLDFGFGLAVQKSVAEKTVKEDYDGLSRIVSTALGIYLGIAVVVTVGGLLVLNPILGGIQISKDNMPEFRMIFGLFVVAMALSLPLSVFGEILRGRQAIWRVNQLTILGLFANIITLSAAIYYEWSFVTIVINTLLCLVGPNVALVGFALREVPELRLGVRYFSTGIAGEISKFSAITYLVTVSYMVLTKTDQFVIGGMMGAAAIAIYQPGAKLGEIFGFATRQLAATLQPAAAHLQATGDQSGLRRLLVDGTRFSVMLATPIYLTFAFLLEPGIRILTGLEDISSETFLAGQALIFWAYFFIFTHNVYKRIAVMCGHERRLMWVGLGEATMNLTLSVLFVALYHSVVGVAVATAVSSSFFGVVFLWRWSCAEAGMSGLEFAKTVLFRNWLACLPMAIWFGLTTIHSGIRSGENIFHAMFVGAVGVALAALGIWVVALNSNEKQMARARLGRITERLNRRD